MSTSGDGGRPSGPSGLLPLRTEYRQVIRALTHGWPITDAVRAELVESAVRDAREAPLVRDRMLAIRTLALLDSVNVKRERLAVEERLGDAYSQAALAHAGRAALDSPAVRQALQVVVEAIASQSVQEAREGQERPVGGLLAGPGAPANGQWAAEPGTPPPSRAGEGSE